MAEPIVPELMDDVASIVRLGLIRAEPVSIDDAGEDLESEIERTCRRLAAEHSGAAPSSIEGLGPAREIYRAFGIDPTRHRPSSEALLRRIVQGKPFPRISNAVDLCNLFAVRFLLSLGLYDAGTLTPPISMRRGMSGESYEGIRKESVHLEGRPVLVDGTGPFGNPTSDSLRTSITRSTRSLWMVIFAPVAFPLTTLESHVRTACDAITRHLAGPAGEVSVDGRVIPR